MLSALYYPHTQLSTEELAGQRILKRALLMWDKLEFIVPDRNFHPFYSDPLVAEAIELIGENHYPSNDEKEKAHERIEELVTRPQIPDAFYYQGSDPYEIYPQKLLPRTWETLIEGKLAGALLPNEDYPLSNQAGLMVMAILADCCAGTTRSRVTDRAQAYAGITNLLADKPKEPENETETRSRLINASLDAVPRKEALISLRLSLLEVDRISLSQLIAFRQREEAEQGHTLRDLRHNYVRRIEEQVKQLTNPDLTQSDVAELERQFVESNKNDLMRLNEELWQEKRDAVLSRDVLVTILAAGGTLASTVFPAAHVLQGVLTATGAPVTLGGVVSARNKFLKARADVLRKHPMALLHELSG